MTSTNFEVNRTTLVTGVRLPDSTVAETFSTGGDKRLATNQKISHALTFNLLLWDYQICKISLSLSNASFELQLLVDAAPHPYSVTPSSSVLSAHPVTQRLVYHCTPSMHHSLVFTADVFDILSQNQKGLRTLNNTMTLDFKRTYSTYSR